MIGAAMDTSISSKKRREPSPLIVRINNPFQNLCDNLLTHLLIFYQDKAMKGLHP